MAHTGGNATNWDAVRPPGVFDDMREGQYDDGTLHGPNIPSLPLERVHPNSLHPNTLTTIYVTNISFDADELDIVRFFNSIGGTFGDFCTALSAVNIPYKRDRKGRPIFAGQGLFMYGTHSLACFAWSVLHRRTFRGRVLQVEMAKRQIECGTSSGSFRGQSRFGEGIFEAPSRT